MSLKLGERLDCAECGGDDLLRDSETGELVCVSCGFVIQSTALDRGAEWRAFNIDQHDTLTRVGAPQTWIIPDKGLSTTIGWNDVKEAGKNLSPWERMKLYRLRRWQSRMNTDSIQRNLVKALSEIRSLSYRLSLPRNVVETASVIYRRAVQRKLIKGKSITSVAVASIYMACRQCGLIRTLDDVSEAASVSRKEAAKNYRYLLKEMGSTVPKSEPQGHISKIVSKLKLRGETERIANLILEHARDLKLTCGRGPSGIAAACVYISCRLTNEKKTQCEIAREAQVAEITIRSRYKELAGLLMFNVVL